MKTRSVFNALIVFFVSFLLAGCLNSGNGEEVGTITSLQHTGIFCKTWEGKIIGGGLKSNYSRYSGSDVVGNVFKFTIKDKTLIKQVREAMESQQEVKITYKKAGFTMCQSDSGDYFLTGITPLKQLVSKQSGEVNDVNTKPLESLDITQRLLNQNTGMIVAQQLMLEEMRKQCEYSRSSKK